MELGASDDYQSLDRRRPPLSVAGHGQSFAGHPGVEVEVCLSAEDAASRCLSQAYDLVVSDLQMPGMDGIQFIQALSAMPNGPLLALVSVDQGRMLASAKLAAQSFGLKVLGVLHKPVHASEVDDLLRRLSSVLVTPRYSPRT